MDEEIYAIEKLTNLLENKKARSVSNGFIRRTRMQKVKCKYSKQD